MAEGGSVVLLVVAVDMEGPLRMVDAAATVVLQAATNLAEGEYCCVALVRYETGL